MEVVMGCIDLEMEDMEVGGSNSDYGLGYGGYGGSNGGNRLGYGGFYSGFGVGYSDFYNKYGGLNDGYVNSFGSGYGGIVIVILGGKWFGGFCNGKVRIYLNRYCKKFW